MSTTLHADLMRHLHAGVLDHPLVMIDDFGDRFVSLANKKYLDKREELDRAKLAGDWQKYIWLHERPYRMHVLWNIADQMSPEQYWRTVRSVWDDAVQTDDLSVWTMLWGSPRPYREHAMTLKERRALKRLSKSVVIYRSVDQPPITRGLVWQVVNREKGQYVSEAVVQRSQIRALLSPGRKVIVFPRDCEDLRIYMRRRDHA